MLDALEALLKDGLPFVAFKPPNAKEVQVYYQKDNVLYKTHDFSEAGFLMAPFETSDRYCYIPNTFRQSFPIPSQDSIVHSNHVIVDDNKESFVAVVQNALEEFKEKKLEKVVVSRVLPVRVHELKPAQTFQNLVLLYSSAFVYYWHHPVTGSWMGATPERFANLKGRQLHTIALAGTSPVNEDQPAAWSSKEIYEQQLVTDSITSSLKNTFPSVQLNLSPVDSYRAGALWHLKTEIQATDAQLSLSKIINALHPTPAVGGIPKSQSVQFILENEGYDRKYYTGFLGLFDSATQADLFVNLRSAEITDSGYNVFVGAGIVVGSDPEKEWIETQRKAKTFCQAL